MFRFLALALAILVPAVSRASADPLVFPAVGLGLALDLPEATIARDIDYGRDPTTVFVEVPLVLGGLRVEPELGFGRGTSASELRWVSGADEQAGWVRGGQLVEQRLVLGLNVGPTVRLADRMRAWAGARAALAARHVDAGDDRLDHLGLDWTLGTVAGTETFLLDHFSLGGEARLSFTSVDGAVLAPRDGGSASLRRGWSLGFDVLAAARFYFR